jgi:addiction module HigA family antidote
MTNTESVLSGATGMHMASRSSTTIRRKIMAGENTRRLTPIHPGMVLKDILDEAGLTVNALALALRVPANRIGAIIKGQRSITADTALRLARYFETSAHMWMNLQARYDIEMAEDSLKEKIEREILPRTAA